MQKKGQNYMQKVLTKTEQTELPRPRRETHNLAHIYQPT
jgi:hypothetical protein